MKQLEHILALQRNNLSGPLPPSWGSLPSRSSSSPAHPTTDAPVSAAPSVGAREEALAEVSAELTAEAAEAGTS